ncbi:hypothetical protein FCL40_01905 [Ferrimonas sediminicola]|uniref:Uncharacterized protein n=1 Tax=Ferrimonas sediminicola TaxID=2569538 RepID=A0A4U1BJI3_9GAMM|nr:hypothetical protein [Ferrimonas sediminicola]TKB51335.1 hypothetical protein FCL40_01905 [Ferrimonas sediminicola]
MYKSFCGWCYTHTRHERSYVDHGLHLTLTLITAGAWSFVWAYLDCTSGSCCQCGLGEGLSVMGYSTAYHQSLRERSTRTSRIWWP